MKNIILIAAIFTMLFLPFTLRSQTQNIVYVDLQRVMLESEKGKEAKKALTSEAERLKKNLDGKQEELQKMKDTIEKQGATINPDARAEKEKQYQIKLKDYQRLYNDYQGELQQKDMEFTQKIVKDLEEIIKNMGEKEKYMLILEKNQAGILYGAPAVDITNKVINLYNEAAKKKTIKK
ncbi:MAG: OmpH family outer membrane protein [Proteobacteria bacterium]|nr:OmpH family outer membrane protein [Pseudomonadota bacterium]